MHQQRSGARLSFDIEVSLWRKYGATAPFPNCLNKELAHRNGSPLKGSDCTGREFQKADLKWCWWVRITAARPRWTYMVNSFYRQKWKIFSSLLFYISLINSPPLPCCHCLALMNLNKLTFSLADKYLSNPAKERQFFLNPTHYLTSVCVLWSDHLVSGLE